MITTGISLERTERDMDYKHWFFNLDGTLARTGYGVVLSGFNGASTTDGVVSNRVISAFGLEVTTS